MDYVFDDLPEELAAALLKQNLYELDKEGHPAPIRSRTTGELINEIRQTESRSGGRQLALRRVLRSVSHGGCAPSQQGEGTFCAGAERSVGVVWRLT